jgi:hypothetical protein
MSVVDDEIHNRKRDEARHFEVFLERCGREGDALARRVVGDAALGGGVLAPDAALARIEVEAGVRGAGERDSGSMGRGALCGPRMDNCTRGSASQPLSRPLR